MFPVLYNRMLEVDGFPQTFHVFDPRPGGTQLLGGETEGDICVKPLYIHADIIPYCIALPSILGVSQLQKANWWPYRLRICRSMFLYPLSGQPKYLSHVPHHINDRCEVVHLIMKNIPHYWISPFNAWDGCHRRIPVHSLSKLNASGAQSPSHQAYMLFWPPILIWKQYRILILVSDNDGTYHQCHIYLDTQRYHSWYLCRHQAKATYSNINYCNTEWKSFPEQPGKSRRIVKRVVRIFCLELTFC